MFVLLLNFALAIQPFMFQGFFTVFGTVRDDDGRVVTSVRVSLVDENYQPKGTVITDSSGRYRFRNLRAGSYYLHVEPTGLPYEQFSKQIDLYSLTPRASTFEEPTLEDIVLKRKRSPSNAVGTPGVVFVQVVPPAAREEFEHATSTIKQKNFVLGIASLKKALEIFPDYFDALELLGTQYVKLAQFESSIPILTRALAVNNKSASGLYALGVAHLKLGQLSESIESLQSAIALNPRNANSYLMLGVAYGQNGSLDQAEIALKKAYQQGGADASDAHLYLAGIYDKRARFAEAWRELELYLRETKGLKDKTQIKEMIVHLKAKDKSKH
jgi:Flp pilus assembly protein TadD, contains TPR repeats